MLPLFKNVKCSIDWSLKSNNTHSSNIFDISTSNLVTLLSSFKNKLVKCSFEYGNKCFNEIILLYTSNCFILECVVEIRLNLLRYEFNWSGILNIFISISLFISWLLLFSSFEIEDEFNCFDNDDVGVDDDNSDDADPDDDDVDNDVDDGDDDDLYVDNNVDSDNDDKYLFNCLLFVQWYQLIVEISIFKMVLLPDPTEPIIKIGRFTFISCHNSIIWKNNFF